jgi:hypothetical protein
MKELPCELVTFDLEERSSKVVNRCDCDFWTKNKYFHIGRFHVVTRAFEPETGVNYLLPKDLFNRGPVGKHAKCFKGVCIIFVVKVGWLEPQKMWSVMGVPGVTNPCGVNYLEEIST